MLLSFGGWLHAGQMFQILPSSRAQFKLRRLHQTDLSWAKIILDCRGSTSATTFTLELFTASGCHQSECHRDLFDKHFGLEILSYSSLDYDEHSFPYRDGRITIKL